MGNLTGVLTPVKIIVSLHCTQTINYIYYPTNVLHAPLLKAQYLGIMEEQSLNVANVQPAGEGERKSQYNPLLCRTRDL